MVAVLQVVQGAELPHCSTPTCPNLREHGFTQEPTVTLGYQARRELNRSGSHLTDLRIFVVTKGG